MYWGFWSWLIWVEMIMGKTLGTDLMNIFPDLSNGAGIDRRLIVKNDPMNLLPDLSDGASLISHAPRLVFWSFLIWIRSTIWGMP
jgi:hypothetical protein